MMLKLILTNPPYLNIMLNSFRASSVTPVVFLKDKKHYHELNIAALKEIVVDAVCGYILYLACICCSRLCCILIPN